MSASEDLDKTVINGLRVDMARVNAMEYHALVVLHDQLQREVNRERYDHSPKTRVRR